VGRQSGITSANKRGIGVGTPAFLALSCIGAFATSPAFAEEAALADETAMAASAEDSGGGRTDIIVNGEREEVSAKDVARPINTPRSVVTVSSSVIEQTGSASLADALRTVPGITFGAAEGGNPVGDRPFIRGFDAQGSIFVDGVRNLASQSREVFAIDSVQIVRGSDSTLGGRGAAGGTINIVSKLPQPETFATVSGSYGSADYKRMTGDLNLKLADTASFRIQGLWHDQDVAGRDAIWQKRWGFAPSVSVGLGTDTRITASYYYLESHELPDSGLPYLNVCSATLCNAPAGEVFTTPALGTVTVRDGTTGKVDRSTYYGLKDRDFRDTKSQSAMLRAEHDFGDVTLRNTARFTHDDQAYIFTQPDDSQGNVFGNPNFVAGSPNAVTGGNRLTGGGYVWRRSNTRYSFTQSLSDQVDLFGRFKTGGIEHSFSVGAEVDWEKARRGTFVLQNGSTITPRCDTTTVARYNCTSLFNPSPNDPWQNFTTDTSAVATPIVRGASNTETQNEANTVSIYGFDSITLTPQLILNLGARYDRFKSTITPPFAAGAAAIKLSRKDELFNWQAGLIFKPSRDTSLYASYATSATPPNSLLGEGREDNALPTTGATANLLDVLKPQKTKSYEAGAKANLFDERLGLGIAVFQTDIANARVTDADNNIAFLGESRVRGVELTVNGTILPGWTVFGGYSFLDGKIRDGGFSTLTAPAVGTQGTKTVLVPSVNTGKQMPQLARNSFTATTAYQVTPKLQFGGTAIYMARQYGGYGDNRTATQNAAGVVTVNPATVQLARGVPSYWRFDAQASYAVNDAVRLSVNAQNLTNKAYFSQTFTTHYAAIAAGRTVFGTVTLKY
jgi:catecholate siderophore receptor